MAQQAEACDIGDRVDARDLRQITEQRPFVCHGLSLNLGGPAPLDKSLLHRIKGFMSQHGMTLYTEHLSWCAADSQLYELLPLPLSEAAAPTASNPITAAITATANAFG